MKKIFLLAASAIVVLASCTKNQIIETPADRNAIGFEMYAHKATKASTMDITKLQTAAQFPVVSYLNNLTAGNPTSSTLFYDENLLFAGGKWDTAVTRYWPSTTVANPATQSLSFFGYYPKANVTYDQNGYPTTMPTLGYTVVNDTDAQVDVLGGSALNKTNVGGTTDEVVLQLEHLLAQVNFFIKGEHDGLKYKVTALTIGGALGKIGTYTFGATIPWAVTAGTETYTYTGSFPTDGFDKTGAKLDDETVGTGKAMMLMPQTIAANNFITVTYSVTDDRDNVLLPSAARQVAVTGTWEPAHRYLYTITLKDNLNPITYDVKVGDWTTGTTNPLEIQ